MLLTPGTSIRLLQTDLESSRLNSNITLSEIASFYGRFCNFFQNCNKIDDDQICILVKCTLRYVECICNLVERMDVLKQLEIRAIKQYISVVSDIPYLEGIKDTFMKLISNQILEKITYTRIKPFVSKELIKHFNLALQRINRELRSIIAESSKIYLCKLVQIICTCGDYDYQTLSLEAIFRLCTRDQINRFATEFFPGSMMHRNGFLQITTRNFDNDIRVFLNVINNEFKSVFSFKCHRVLLGDITILPPQNSDGILWVDFNMGSKTITVLCNQDCVRRSSSNSPENDDWEIILTMISDIGKAQMSNLTVVNSSESIGAVIIFNLTAACTFKYSSVSNAVEARVLELAILKCTELKQLEEKVLPKLLGEKFEVLSSSWIDDSIAVKKIKDVNLKPRISCTKATKNRKREYKPLKFTIAKQAKRFKAPIPANDPVGNILDEEKKIVSVAKSKFTKCAENIPNITLNNQSSDICTSVGNNSQDVQDVNIETACVPDIEKQDYDLDEAEKDSNLFDSMDIDETMYESSEPFDSNTDVQTETNNEFLNMSKHNSTNLSGSKSNSLANILKTSVNNILNTQLEIMIPPENVTNLNQKLEVITSTPVAQYDTLLEELNNSIENNQLAAFDNDNHMQNTESHSNECSSSGYSIFEKSDCSTSTTYNTQEDNKDSSEASKSATQMLDNENLLHAQNMHTDDVFILQKDVNDNTTALQKNDNFNNNNIKCKVSIAKHFKSKVNDKQVFQDVLVTNDDVALESIAVKFQQVSRETSSLATNESANLEDEKIQALESTCNWEPVVKETLHTDNIVSKSLTNNTRSKSNDNKTFGKCDKLKNNEKGDSNCIKDKNYDTQLLTQNTIQIELENSISQKILCENEESIKYLSTKESLLQTIQSQDLVKEAPIDENIKIKCQVSTRQESIFFKKELTKNYKSVKVKNQNKCLENNNKSKSIKRKISVSKSEKKHMVKKLNLNDEHTQPHENFNKQASKVGKSEAKNVYLEIQHDKIGMTLDTVINPQSLNDDHAIRVSIAGILTKKQVKKVSVSAKHEISKLNTEINPEDSNRCIENSTAENVQLKHDELSIACELNESLNKSNCSDNLSNVTDRNRTTRELYSNCTSANTTLSENHATSSAIKLRIKNAKECDEISKSESTHCQENDILKYRKLYNPKDFLNFVGGNSEDKDFDTYQENNQVSLKQQSTNDISTKTVSRKLTDITNNKKHSNLRHINEDPIRATFKKQRTKVAMEKTEPKISKENHQPRKLFKKNKIAKIPIKKQGKKVKDGAKVVNEKVSQQKQDSCISGNDEIEESLPNVNKGTDSEGSDFVKTQYTKSFIGKKKRGINVENSSKSVRQTRSKTKAVGKLNREDITCPKQVPKNATATQGITEFYKNDAVLKQNSLETNSKIKVGNSSLTNGIPKENYSIDCNESDSKLSNCKKKNIPIKVSKKIEPIKHKAAKNTHDEKISAVVSIVDLEESVLSEKTDVIKITDDFPKRNSHGMTEVTEENVLKMHNEPNPKNITGKVLSLKKKSFNEPPTVVETKDLLDLLEKNLVEADLNEPAENRISKNDSDITNNLSISNKTKLSNIQEEQEDNIINILDSVSTSYATTSNLLNNEEISNGAEHTGEETPTGNGAPEKALQTMEHPNDVQNLQVCTSNFNTVHKKKHIDIKQIIVIKSDNKKLQNSVESKSVNNENQKHCNKTTIDCNRSSDYVDEDRLKENCSDLNINSDLICKAKATIPEHSADCKKSKDIIGSNNSEVLTKQQELVKNSLHTILKNTSMDVHANIEVPRHFKNIETHFVSNKESSIKSHKCDDKSSVVLGKNITVKKSKENFHDLENVINKASTVSCDLTFNPFDALKTDNVLDNQTLNKNKTLQGLFKVPKSVEIQTKKKYSTEHGTNLARMDQSEEPVQTLRKLRHSDKHSEEKFKFNSWLNSLRDSFTNSTTSNTSYESSIRNKKSYASFKKPTPKKPQLTKNVSKDVENYKNLSKECISEEIENKRSETIRNEVETFENRVGRFYDANHKNIKTMNNPRTSKEKIVKPQKRHNWMKLLKRFVSLTLKQHAETYGFLKLLMKNSETNFVKEYKTVHSLNKRLQWYTKKYDN